jgi:protein involved in polysaccharide export with SLBB domain
VKTGIVERNAFTGIACIAVAALLICLGGCTSESVTSDTARAMSTPGLGPSKFPGGTRSDVLNPGDQLQLTVLGYPEFNTTTGVKPSGMFPIPLIGEVKAAGLTRDELQDDIVRKLSEYVKTKVYVTLNLTSASVQNIVVLGAVAQQNSYPNSSPVSIFQLLANAGGPSADADLRHIKVYRNGDLSKEQEIDLSGIVSPGERTDQRTPMVSPGDLVYVPKSENFVRQFSPFVYDILVVVTLLALVR